MKSIFKLKFFSHWVFATSPKTKKHTHTQHTHSHTTHTDTHTLTQPSGFSLVVTTLIILWLLFWFVRTKKCYPLTPWSGEIYVFAVWMLVVHGDCIVKVFLIQSFYSLLVNSLLSEFSHRFSFVCKHFYIHVFNIFSYKDLF